MSGRFRTDSKDLFDVFVEVVRPSSDGAEPWILQTYPHTVTRESVASVPQFVFPCEFEITTVQNFSFVLTKDDAKWTFGFCRLSPDSDTALVILSSLPWHDAFYKILNYSAELMHRSEVSDLLEFLSAVHASPIPKAGSSLSITWGVSPGTRELSVRVPNHYDLPSIPENRNLTEYYNAVGIHSMLVVFASMLYERRVIIVSKKLSRLSACVQAANSIIYPMQWQHIFIPILPKQFLDYLSAPMPFLIGVPEPIFQRAKRNEIGDAVILDADENQIQTPFADLESLPLDVSNNLKKSLKNHKDLLGDSVARAFLHALVHLIGGYRDALKCRPNENITFDKDSFIRSRSPTLQPFLEQMLRLQIFQQFIEERLNLLNSGKGISDEFEKEAVCFTEKSGGSNKKLKAQYSVLSSSMKKEGGAIVKAVKNKANPAMKQAVQSVRDGSKTAYKEFRSRIREGPTQGSRHTVRRKELHRTNSCSSAPSSPTLKRNNRSLSITSVGSGNSSSSTTGLPSLTRNNTDLNLLSGRILKYERFDPPSISTFENEKSPEMEGPPPLDLDLMNDLQDVIFKNKEEEKKTVVPPAVNRQSNSSVGDLINLASAEASPESPSDVIFDPLLLEEPLKKPLRPPPGNPFAAAPANGQPLVMTKSTTSSSSDDLLQEYGIDFGKMSVGGIAPPRCGGNMDLLSDLDPLRNGVKSDCSSSLSRPNPHSWVNRQAHPPPMAPPRAAAIRKQNWTTFD